MKIFITSFLFSALLISCGKSNQVSSNNSVTGNNSVLVESSNFIGVYDLVKMESDDCGASVRIVAECNGIKLLSNNLGPEEFCNINQGEIISSNDPRDGRNKTSTLVTQEGNQLKSVIKILDNGRNEPGRTGGMQLTFTNTLTLSNDGSTLSKISHLKSRESRCLYQKR